MRFPNSDPPEEKQASHTPFGVFLLSFIAGIILVVLGGKSLHDDYRVLHKLTHLDEEYRPTTAKMLQVQVRRDSLQSGDKCYPDVLFEYFVEGKSVWGWRFSYEEEPRHRAYWEKRLARYRVGDTVTAYVSPLDPKDSFLEKKSDSLLRPGLKTAMAAVFVLIGILLTLIPVTMLLGNLAKKKFPAQ